MDKPARAHDLRRLIEVVSTQLGLHFPETRLGDLKRAATSAARECNCNDLDSFTQWLSSAVLTEKEMEAMARHFTIGETYFFRDRVSMEALEHDIFPELIQQRQPLGRNIRIWSAGCSTGEEPYSVAMLLHKMIPDNKGWNIKILGTDINPHSLEMARKGIYRPWSFRETPSRIKERYFKKRDDGHWELLSCIKEMVRFAYLNLARDPFPALHNNTAAMDVILCRNVLMYFDTKIMEQVAEKMYHALMETGWLLVSPVEVASSPFSRYNAVNVKGAFFYRKEKQLTRSTGRGSPHLSPDRSLHPLPLSIENQVMAPPSGGFRESEHAAPPVSPYEEALIHVEQRNYAQAETSLLSLLPKKPDDSRAMALLSRTLANQGKLADALEWCEKAISAERINPVYYYLLGTILQNQGETGKAIQVFQKALYLDQNFVLAHFTLGNLTHQLGKLRESERHMRNTLSLLAAMKKEEVVPESDGLTAERLAEIVQSMLQR